MQQGNAFNSLFKQFCILTTLQLQPFKNIFGKGENAGNQHFLIFPQCFLLSKDKSVIKAFHLLSANAFISDCAKVLGQGPQVKSFS